MILRGPPCQAFFLWAPRYAPRFPPLSPVSRWRAWRGLLGVPWSLWGGSQSPGVTWVYHWLTTGSPLPWCEQVESLEGLLEDLQGELQHKDEQVRRATRSPESFVADQYCIMVSSGGSCTKTSTFGPSLNPEP